MQLAELKTKIEAGRAKMAVIGLGYVGLPVACEFARVGFDVLGVEIDAARVAKINAGESPIEGDEPGLAELLAETIGRSQLKATTDYAQLADRDVVLIDVETPVGEDHRPRYVALRSALTSLGPVLKEGALVIVESTIAPRTMHDLVLPLLEEGSGRKLNEGFYLGNCPERVMPGKLLANLRSLSRVLGGMTAETAEVMLSLYQRVVEADLDPTDCLTAELVKTAENAYRDVQIAFANEVALICEQLGGDVWQVRELVNKSPYRAMHLPGAGVGGHCIPKDPWLLIANLGEDYQPTLIPTARAVNDRMPVHMAQLTAEALAQAGIPLTDAKVAVLGYAYLENSDDTRNTPSQALVANLEKLGVEVVVHDPFVPEYQGDLLQLVAEAHALVLMVAHDAYRNLDFSVLGQAMAQPIMVDGRNVFAPAALAAAGWHYRGVGRASS